MQELVKKYSEFINFPIYLWASKEIDVEVPVEENEDPEDVEDKPEDEDVAGKFSILVYEGHGCMYAFLGDKFVRSLIVGLLC